MDNPSYYAIIPANVRYDKSLKPNEKLLYGEITALANKDGYCWSTNGYFSKLYGVNKNTISMWINNLINRGYLRVEFVYKDGTKEIELRKLYINCPIHEKMDTPIHGKIDTPIHKKMDTPIHGNVEVNNTSVNNTSINTQEGRKEINTDVILQNNILKGTGTISGKQNKNPQTPFGGDAKKFKTFKEMIQEFTENEQLISELKKFTESYFYTHKIRLGSAQFEKLLITLKELSKGDDNIAVKIVSLSIESGWKKFYPLKDDKKEKKSGSFFTKADEQSYDDYEKGRNNLDLALDENGNPLVF